MGAIRRPSWRNEKGQEVLWGAGRSQESLPVCREVVRRPSRRDGRSGEVLRVQGGVGKPSWMAGRGRERREGSGVPPGGMRESGGLPGGIGRETGGVRSASQKAGRVWESPRRAGRIRRPLWSARRGREGSGERERMGGPSGGPGGLEGCPGVRSGLEALPVGWEGWGGVKRPT